MPWIFFFNEKEKPSINKLMAVDGRLALLVHFRRDADRGIRNHRRPRQADLRNYQPREPRNYYNQDQINERGFQITVTRGKIIFSSRKVMEWNNQASYFYIDKFF